MLKNRQDLINARDTYKQKLELQAKKVLVCAGTGCVAGGSLKVYDKISELLNQKGIKCSLSFEKEAEATVGVKKSGCPGFCDKGPLVIIEPYGYFYTKVTPEDCEEIVDKSVVNGEFIERLAYQKDGVGVRVQKDIPFYTKQTRLVLEDCGKIDATSIQEYIAIGGYKALEKSLFDLSQDEIIKEVEASNLRGRGGGGYPTGKKWAQVKRQQTTEKYVVCNGDEGDPGAFMDQGIMEGVPHKLLEGMLIAGYACGASTGYIYVRAEYPLAVSRLKNAISQAREMGLIGENILGTSFCFDFKINMGAGAFVCGEGSALTASIEGKRGMPRTKPPRTVEQGLFGKPTVLNNVETLATVPIIVERGADWYKTIGPENSPGTKAFALTGNIQNTGLIEVPLGMPLKEVIFDIGGGIRNNGKFKAVQIGGPSGGCLTNDHLDLPLDFDSLKKVGAMVGSGGLVVLDDSTCMVEVARFFMSFTQRESCGKCTPCREGTKRMLEILERIVDGRGVMEDLDLLQDLAETIKSTALCGLGKTAPSPVLSTLKHFRDEYITHIVDKRCASRTCGKLKRIYIVEEECKGCSKCAKACPAGAITGVVKEPFKIDETKCIKCDACISTCAFNAIKEEF